MTFYLDNSALVKLYVQELGSDKMHHPALVEDRQRLFVVPVILPIARQGGGAAELNARVEWAPFIWQRRSSFKSSSRSR